LAAGLNQHYEENSHWLKLLNPLKIVVYASFQSPPLSGFFIYCNLFEKNKGGRLYSAGKSTLLKP